MNTLEPAPTGVTALWDRVIETEPVYTTAGRLLWRQIDGEWLVFAPPTGALCATPPLAAAVLVLLEEAPRSCPALVHALAEATGDVVDALQVVTVLKELAVLGVVEPVA